jgi:DNA invertase Pin-like site-specific DNA recombinase
MAPAPDRVAVYARVSTREQTCETQVDQLVLFAQAKGWTNVQVFRDEGISGARDNRPALDALRDRMRKREFSTVLATKMDRLGRSVQGIRAFWDEADLYGVRVICADQGFDSSTPAGRLIRDVLASIAEFERELIMERTQQGVQRARNLGKKFGRPRTVAPAVRLQIVQEALAGAKPKELAKRLGLKENTVRTIITREGGSTQSPPTKSVGSPTTVRTSDFNPSSLNGGGALPESKPPAGKGPTAGGSTALTEGVP